MGFPHRVLDGLTAMKLRVGWVRRRVRLGTLTPEAIERSEAVRLFVDRAQAAVAKFALTLSLKKKLAGGK